MERKIGMEINKYITFLTFIPWVFMYVVSIIRNLNNKEYHTFSWKYLKKNILRIFRIDTLFLIIVYFYFASFDMEFVSEYLFAVICLYLFVNSFYEKKKPLKKDFLKNYIGEAFLLFLYMLLPFLGYYIMYYDLVFIYKWMLLSLFFEYFLILIGCMIVKLFKNILKK